MENEKKLKKISLLINADAEKALRIIAINEGITLSKMIRLMIKNKLESCGHIKASDMIDSEGMNV